MAEIKEGVVVVEVGVGDKNGVDMGDTARTEAGGEGVLAGVEVAHAAGVVADYFAVGELEDGGAAVADGEEVESGMVAVIIEREQDEESDDPDTYCQYGGAGDGEAFFYGEGGVDEQEVKEGDEPERG